MNNFFQFLRRHTTTIIFIILEALALALVFTGNDYHRAAYLSSANVVTGSINRLTSSVGKYFDLATANESLAEQNLALQQEVAALRAQLMAVPDSVWPDIPLQAQQPSLRYHAAKVIGSSTNRSRNMITIDRGAANGVKQDMAVINPQGVVGLVAAVSQHFALVLPIINTSSRLSVKIKRQNHRGQLLWDGMSPQRAQLSDIPEHATVDIGDTVITSGASAFFPEGLVVGTISAIEPDRNGGFFDIDIDLAVDYNAVYHVYLIENLAAQERNDLEKSASDE